MNETQLKIFIHAADCKSLTKAADRLFLSAPAVMNQVNALETDLGVKLFHRSPRGITLTEAGESVYKDAKSLLKGYERLIRNAREAAACSPFLIRVGTSFLAPCKVLMDLWAEVNDRYPQFKVQIVPFEYTNKNILSILENLGTDFDFIVSPCGSIRWRSLCNVYELGSYEVSIAVSHSHPLAKKKQVTLEDLNGETLLMVKRGDSVILDKIRDEIEKEHPEIQIQDTPYFYDFHVFNQCEQQQCAMLTLAGWADIHPSLKTISVDWDYTMPYGLLYPLKPSEDVLHFLDIIKR